MNVNTTAVCVSLLMCALFAAPPTLADDRSYKFEITPFAAYRTGGQFDELDGSAEFELDESNAFGLLLNGSVRPDAQWEFLYAKQDTQVDTQGLLVGDPVADLSVEYYQFGGTLLFTGDKVRPFIALTLGMSRFDPEPAEFNAENFFSGSFGAGLQLMSTQRIGLRLEGRVYGTFVDDNSRIFCGSGPSGGGCLVEIEGSVVTQWEARAGVIVRF
ncbi:MAG: hypothetical protein WBN61_04120 [Woeseiaceae bacterium]